MNIESANLSIYLVFFSLFSVKVTVLENLVGFYFSF